MSTLRVLLEQFVEEQRIGRLGTTTGAGSATTVVDLTRFGGPFAGNDWTRGDPIRITSGDRVGQNTFLDQLAPSTGTLTVSPALTGAPGTGAAFMIVRRTFADHIDRLIEALNRGLNRWARRRQRVGLSYVPDGDLLGAAVATFWAGVNATPAYVDLAHPEGYATRVLEVLTSGVNGYATSVRDIPCRAGETWDFETTMRAAAASSTAQLVIRDITNGADIIPALSDGALTAADRALTLVRGSFVIPAGCRLWRPRFQGQESGARVQFGPFLCAPRGATVYTSQAHFQFPIDSGDWFTRSGQPELSRFRQVGPGCVIDQLGWGLAFNFTAAPPFPLYIESLIGYQSLAADTDTTHCPDDLALAAMEMEFYESLARRNAEYAPMVDVAREKLATFERRFGPEQSPTVRRAYSGVVH